MERFSLPERGICGENRFRMRENIQSRSEIVWKKNRI